jgi:fatty-acyl-CoA synthase
MKAGQTTTEEEVKDFCKGKIAHYKIPRYVMFVNDFPINISGKIQKYKMREESIKVLGLHEADKIETA